MSQTSEYKRRRDSWNPMRAADSSMARVAASQYSKDASRRLPCFSCARADSRDGGGAKTALASVATLRHCELEHVEELMDVVCEFAHPDISEVVVFLGIGLQKGH